MPSAVHTFTTANTVDASAPTVLAVTPGDGATNVGQQAVITLTFSESLAPATVNGNTIAVFNGARELSITPTRSADNRMVSLSTTLDPDSVITVVATTAITDLSGNPLATEFVSSFTTAPALDVTSPAIVTMRPSGSGVAQDTVVTLFANSPLNPAAVAGALYVSQNGTLVTGDITMSASNMVVTFAPHVAFVGGAVVEVNLTNAAQDLSGNPLTTFSGTFTVAADPATRAPTIVRTNPPLGSSGNPRNVVIEAEFSEPLDPSTVTSANVFVKDATNTTLVPGTLSMANGDRVIRFTPTSTLAANQFYYYVYLTNGLCDLQGVPFAGNGNLYNFYFNTGASTDLVAPAAAIVPPNGSTGVGVNGLAHVTFSEPIDPLSANATTVIMSSPAGTIPTTLALSSGNTLLVVTPAVPLPPQANVTISLNGVRDAAGNAAPAAAATFSAAAGADVVRPTATANVVATMPVNSVFDVVFSEPMDVPSVLVFQNQFLYDNTTGYVTGGTMSFSADGRSMTYVPPANLVAGRGYSINLSSSARDLPGNAFTALGLSFTAAAADTTPPQVRAVNPGDGLVAVRRNAKIEILFDEPIAPTSLSNVNVTRERRSDWDRNGHAVERESPADADAHGAPGVEHRPYDFDRRDRGRGRQRNADRDDGVHDRRQHRPRVAAAAAVLAARRRHQRARRHGADGDVCRADRSGARAAQFDGSNSGVYLRLTATSAVVPSTLSFSADFRTVTITPTAPLSANTQYQIVSNLVYDVAGNATTGGLLTSGFTTAGAGGMLTAPPLLDFRLSPQKNVTPAFPPVALVASWTVPAPSRVAPPPPTASSFSGVERPRAVDVANTPPR